MHFLGNVVAAAALFVATAAAATTPEPKRYIVELKTLGCGDRVKSRVEAAPGLRIAKAFDHELFPALSIECDDCDADSLARLLDGGEHVDTAPVATVYTPSVMTLRLPEEGPSYTDDAAALNYTFHGHTGVEKLHKMGIIGEGATVAIVDSGVEWTHEALGGGFGPGYKVEGGYDLVGDGDWPFAPATPDSMPNDQFGHGTHVAGIVAGKSEQFVGVAPAAKLLSYKVIGRNGASNEEMVIEGFLKAFDSGADIITASVGEKNGFSNNAWAVVASRMVDQGVLVTVAGGNDGDQGAFLMSNGAAGKHVLTVAATSADMVPGYPFTASFVSKTGDNKTEELAYSPAPGNLGPEFFPKDIAGWPIVPLTLNSTVAADACEPIANSTSLPEKSVLLVRLGGCEMWKKQQNLNSLANLSYVLFYQDGQAPFTTPSSSRDSKYKIAVIDAKAGVAIIEELVAGGQVQASFDQATDRFVGMLDAGGGRPADFTQWGPNYDMEMKPDIAAPGVKVLSSYIGGGYKVLSGTSMATPYVAGVAALYVGKYGGRKSGDRDWAKRLAARIMSTARSAPWVMGDTSAINPDFLASPALVGAGGIQADRVFEATTEFNFDGRKFQLNDTANFNAEQSVDITNSGLEAATYEFSIEGAGGFDSWVPGPKGGPYKFGENMFKGSYDIKPVKMDPLVDMPAPLTLAPGETKTAKFTFTPPAGMNERSIPLYGGRVIIKSSTGESFGIPYLGAGSDIKDVVPGVFAHSSGMPNMVIGTSVPGGIPIADHNNFTFDLSRDIQDFPILVVSFSYGTAQLRWDIYDAEAQPDLEKDVEWQYPPVPGRNGYLGSATWWTHSEDTSYFDPSKPGNKDTDFNAFPRYNMPRDVYKQHMWLGRLADGKKLQPGRYRMRVAALRPMGVPEVAGDWDVWRTPIITVLPLSGSNTTEPVARDLALLRSRAIGARL